MTIKANIRPAMEVLDDVRDAARVAPREMKRAFNSKSMKIRYRFVQALKQEPGPPKYPLRWKSKPQRRYVMWKLRTEGNLPYQRTHQLSLGWEVHVRLKDFNGTISVENPAPSARYVVGADQQPFHIDTGWYFFDALARQYEREYEAAVIEAWFEVADPFTSGAPT